MIRLVLLAALLLLATGVWGLIFLWVVPAFLVSLWANAKRRKIKLEFQDDLSEDELRSHTFLGLRLKRLTPGSIQSADFWCVLFHFKRALTISWPLEMLKPKVWEFSEEEYFYRMKREKMRQDALAEKYTHDATEEVGEGLATDDVVDVEKPLSETSVPTEEDLQRPSLDFLSAYRNRDWYTSPADVSWYDERFRVFVENFDTSKFMKDGHINPGVLSHTFGGGLSDLSEENEKPGDTFAEYLESQGISLFVGLTDEAFNELCAKTEVYALELQSYNEKEALRMAQEELNSPRGYLLKTLGFEADNLSDDELNYAVAVITNFFSFALYDGELAIKGLGTYTHPTELHEIILGTIRGPGSLFELTQNWFALAYSNELILWSAGEMEIDEVFKAIRKRNELEDDENFDLTKVTAPTLSEAVGETSFKAYSHGHDLSWQANRTTAIALKYLNAFGYERDLLKLSDAFWNFIFDGDFKKDKLFSSGQINNREDIIKAHAKIEEKSKIQYIMVPGRNSYSASLRRGAESGSREHTRDKKAEAVPISKPELKGEGKVYRITNPGYPLGVYREGKIYEVTNQGYPIGIFKSGKIYRITQLGYPVGVYHDGKIYKITNQGYPVAVYRHGKLYEVMNQGYPIGVYPSEDEGGAAALALLLDLI